MDEPAANIGRDIGDEYREAAARSAEIGDGEHQAGRDDANADLGAARHSEGEGIAIDAPHRAKFVTDDDRSGDGGKRSTIGCEIAQQRRAQRANAAPKCQAEQ